MTKVMRNFKIHINLTKSKNEDLKMPMILVTELPE